jgi:hypothetical protein
MADTSDSERPLKVDKQIQCPACGVFPIHGSVGAIYNCLVSNLFRERNVTRSMKGIITVREATIKTLMNDLETRDSRIRELTGRTQDNGKEN